MTNPRYCFLLLCATLMAASSAAQSAVFTKLDDQVVHPKLNFAVPGLITSGPVKEPAAPLPACFLPQWRADDLAFFCKIEYRVARHDRLAFKFRLGSVEYVDWLEGKQPLNYHF